MNTITYLKRTLKQLAPYLGRPLTPAERDIAITLHLKALTECRIAIREQKVVQEAIAEILVATRGIEEGVQEEVAHAG